MFCGTPGETRTHYLALRRRTLYPGELRGQIYILLRGRTLCVRLRASLRSVACLHAACGRCIQVSYGGKCFFILSNPLRSVNATEEKSLKPPIFGHTAVAKLVITIYNNYL